MRKQAAVAVEKHEALADLMDLVSNITAVLIGMRKQLISGGFSEDGAEDICRIMTEGIDL